MRMGLLGQGLSVAAPMLGKPAAAKPALASNTLRRLSWWRFAMLMMSIPNKKPRQGAVRSDATSV